MARVRAVWDCSRLGVLRDLCADAAFYRVLHFNKAEAEALPSIAGELLLGTFAWRCGSFWIAVSIHFMQMLDFCLQDLNVNTLWLILFHGW